MSQPRGEAWGRAGAVLALVLAIDQASKALLRNGLAVGEEDPILPGIKLVHIRNDGVAFGFLSKGGVILALVVTGALLLLLVYFATHSAQRYAWLPTGLLLGGAAGNIVDRVRDGAVTDFLKLPAWPAFNVADMAITLGVLALLWVVEGAGERPAD